MLNISFKSREKLVYLANFKLVAMVSVGRVIINVVIKPESKIKCNIFVLS